MTHRLLRCVICLSVVATVVPAAPALAEPASPPTLTAGHRVFLSRIARRTLRDVALGRVKYEPEYIPAALESLTLEAVVRVRQGGLLIVESNGGPAPVAEAVRDAAFAAATIWATAEPIDVELLPSLIIEIEVVGPPEPIDLDVDWTKPRAVDPFIEPGVHGVVLSGPRIHRRFCPTEVFTNDMVMADALELLARNVLSNPSQVRQTQLQRFRTLHWYQASSRAEPVALHRGLTIVPPSAVSERELDECIDRLATYMCYRQQASGLFAYLYEPAWDRYSEDNNIVRQVGATAAMAFHAQWSGKAASHGAADLGIRYHLAGLTDFAGVENGAFVATADGQNKLGVTALLTIAMAQHPDAKQYADVRERLVNGMLALQQPSGVFVTAFPPADKVTAQDYFPGEALLAMAQHYSHMPNARILDAFDRAISFYREYFRNRPSPAFVPWQVQAYTLMACHGKRRDYVDYVFELTDWLADKQLDSADCPWPELRGGIAAYQPGRAGVATAAYLEGFADALALAREVGDVARAQRYERVMRGAVRFVMQLQVRPEEAYFIRSPRDAVGAIRTTPSLNLLRIDHCQHALVGLIKARQTLFGDDD